MCKFEKSCTQIIGELEKDYNSSVWQLAANIKVVMNERLASVTSCVIPFDIPSDDKRVENTALETRS